MTQVSLQNRMSLLLWTRPWARTSLPRQSRGGLPGLVSYSKPVEEEEVVSFIGLQGEGWRLTSPSSKAQSKCVRDKGTESAGLEQRQFQGEVDISGSSSRRRGLSALQPGMPKGPHPSGETLCSHQMLPRDLKAAA